jgi:diguanylate cyclase (GGDEF)-like protein
VTQGTAGFFVAALGLIALANIFHGKMEAARNESERDPLTGLLNRRGLDRIAARLDPRRTKVSVIQCDLDVFKRINDTYGHTVGDKVLQRVAELLSSALPPKAVASRFGGEEFVILVQDMGLSEAGMLAHRMRLAFGGVNWQVLGISDQVTASFGVALWSQGDHALGEALTRADGALYLAKSAGRNQVYLESRLPYDVPGPKLVRSA